MQLADIVPWGRSFDEYRAMLALSDADLERRILGCGDGPASFNAEASARGARVVSVDPIYAFDANAIARRIAAVRPQIEAGLREAPERYHWEHFANVDALVHTRLAAMQRFLTDYSEPGASARYLSAALPALPLRAGQFDLALVSHLLFTYSEHLGAEGHRAAVAELMRVAPEVRIYPLLTLDGHPSPYLESVITQAEAAGWSAEMVAVDYLFQRGADRMLQLRAPARKRTHRGALGSIRRNHSRSQDRTRSGPGTLPECTTFSSMTTPGVDMTP